jgi:hypothetical protein
MKHKVGKEREEGRKKCKEVGNDNSSASMFGKHQAVSALNKASETVHAHLHKGTEMGLDEAAQAKPVRRPQKDTHDTKV